MVKEAEFKEILSNYPYLYSSLLDSPYTLQAHHSILMPILMQYI